MEETVLDQDMIAWVIVRGRLLWMLVVCVMEIIFVKIVVKIQMVVHL